MSNPRTILGGRRFKVIRESRLLPARTAAYDCTVVHAERHGEDLHVSPALMDAIDDAVEYEVRRHSITPRKGKKK